MNPKSMKIIKLALALFAMTIFFFVVFLYDYSYDWGHSFNFFGLYINPQNFYFLIGLIAVLILATANYFFQNKKFNIIANILALVIVASYIIKMFLGIKTIYGVSFYVCIHLGILLPIILLVTFFMLDRKFIIKTTN